MRLAQYAKPKLLIIDEQGYPPFEPQAGHVFFQLISRDDEQESVQISSNRPVEEWDEMYSFAEGFASGDQVVVAAILDRATSSHPAHRIDAVGVLAGEDSQGGVPLPP